MRCPACGYHSFEHMEKCKKCGQDLKEFKARYGFFGRFMPKPSKDALEEPSRAEEGSQALGDILADLDYKKEVEDFQTPEPGFCDSEKLGEAQEHEPMLETMPPAWEQIKEKSDVGEKRAEAPCEEFTFGTNEEPALALCQESKQELTLESSQEPEEPEEPFIYSGEQADSPEDGAQENFLGLSEEEESVFELEHEPRPAEDDEGVPGKEAQTVFAEEVGAFEVHAEGEQKFSEAAPESEALPVEEIEEKNFAENFSPLEVALFPGEEATGTENQIFSRLGAWLADCSILSVILLVFVMMGKVGLDSQPQHGLFPTQAALLVELLIPYFFLFFALCFGYFTVFHFLTGQTPGKMLFNIRVEDENGFPLLFSQAFLRSAGGLLSFLLLGVGYLMIFSNPDRRGWNDRLAGTRVVRVEP